MKCRRARQLLFDFFDGMSHEGLRAELDRHLGECAECERFAAEMTSCLALVHRAPMEPLDENFNWKVRLAIHRERNAVRSRGVASSAWTRAWNLRYGMSAGLAFGVVLVVGAVVLRSVGELPATQGVATGVVHDRVVGGVQSPSLVPRPSTVLNGRSLEQMVSNGASSSPLIPAPHGAIDESTTDATIDSLISIDLMRMTPEQRSAYIQRRILQLQLHLQGQRENPARP